VSSAYGGSGFGNTQGSFRSAVSGFSDASQASRENRKLRMENMILRKQLTTMGNGGMGNTLGASQSFGGQTRGSCSNRSRAASARPASRASSRGGMNMQLVQQMRDKILMKWKTLQQAFRAIDEDHSGSMSVQEMGDQMVRFGLLQPAEVNGRDMQVIFRKCDTSGNGMVDFDEFGKLLGSDFRSERPMFLGTGARHLGKDNGGESKETRDDKLHAMGVLL